MVCLGLEPRVGGWKAQTNPMSYGSTPTVNFFAQFNEGNEKRKENVLN